MNITINDHDFKKRFDDFSTGSHRGLDLELTAERMNQVRENRISQPFSYLHIDLTKNTEPLPLLFLSECFICREPLARDLLISTVAMNQIPNETNIYAHSDAEGKKHAFHPRCLYPWQLKHWTSNFWPKPKPETYPCPACNQGVPFPDSVQILPREPELVIAASEGKLAKVRELLSTGLISNEIRERALRKASDKGHFDIVRFFLENNAQISSDPILLQVIRKVCEQGHLDILIVLFENNEFSDQMLGDAFYLSGEHDHFDIVRFFLENNAMIGLFVMDQLLSSACEKGHFDVVTTLIERDDTFSCEMGGFCSFLFAMDAPHFEIVEKFLEKSPTQKRKFLKFAFLKSINCNVCPSSFGPQKVPILFRYLPNKFASLLCLEALYNRGEVALKLSNGKAGDCLFGFRRLVAGLLVFLPEMIALMISYKILESYTASPVSSDEF